jgi:hypothetical protein
MRTRPYARLRPTAVVVVAVAALAAVSSPLHFLHFEADKLLAIVVPVAGTLVALALPAAQLAEASVQRTLQGALQLVRAKRPLPTVVRHLRATVAERREVAAALRCVMVCAVVSFLIGLCGVLGVFADRQLAANLRVPDFIATLSTGFLVAAVLWLLPVLKASFSFEQADRLVEMLEAVPPPKPAAPPPAPPPAP